jgi:translation initiation factor IF-3
LVYLDKKRENDRAMSMIENITASVLPRKQPEEIDSARLQEMLKDAQDKGYKRGFDQGKDAGFSEGEKEAQKSRRNNKQSELKQMRFGLKIGQGDLDIKLRKVREFLAEGHKVRIQIFYRGREMAHKELGYDMINKIGTLLEEEAVFEHTPTMAGRNLSVVVRKK